MNMLNLIHTENTYFLGIIKNMTTSDGDRKLMEDYMNKCNDAKAAIMSRMYEDDIRITH